jgi:peptidyl-prolyl cis-trans isomerase B (cyclophilin B)
MFRQYATALFLSLLMACNSGNAPRGQKSQAGATSVPKSPGFISFSGKTPEELKIYHVILETSEGKIELAFFPEIAPAHVQNFLRLSQAGYYDHTSWHRVVRKFVIQGGDLATRTPSVAAEMASGVRRLQPEFSKLKHVAGILSMARDKELDSAKTSFFICLAPQPVLDNKYSIFGRVVSGMDTVEKIASVAVGKGGKPLDRVELIRAEIIEVPRDVAPLKTN